MNYVISNSLFKVISYNRRQPDKWYVRICNLVDCIIIAINFVCFVSSKLSQLLLLFCLVNLRHKINVYLLSFLTALHCLRIKLYFSVVFR